MPALYCGHVHAATMMHYRFVSNGVNWPLAGIWVGFWLGLAWLGIAVHCFVSKRFSFRLNGYLVSWVGLEWGGMGWWLNGGLATCCISLQLCVESGIHSQYYHHICSVLLRPGFSFALSAIIPLWINWKLFCIIWILWVCRKKGVAENRQKYGKLYLFNLHAQHSALGTDGVLPLHCRLFI